MSWDPVVNNAFEYLLSIMGSQGDAGQFRTPRHIIDMMVEIVAPLKNETILDPACGTAGFLISAYNYIKKTNLDGHGESTLTADDMTRMTWPAAFTSPTASSALAAARSFAFSSSVMLIMRFLLSSDIQIAQ